MVKKAYAKFLRDNNATAPFETGGLRKPFKLAMFLAMLALLSYISPHGFFDRLLYLPGPRSLYDATSSVDMCPQVPPLSPSRNAEIYDRVVELIGDKTVVKEWSELLSRSVQIHTESFDDMGDIGVDPRWDVFIPFHEYLENTFPLVYESLEVVKVNTYGLVYTWKGSAPEDDTKPLLFMGHQDVVPVENATLEQWAHPPFSGYNDGTRIWGRGTSDDKGAVIGILTTIETLLAHGFKPTRTVMMSFGFDEESGSGASKLAEYLLEKHGPDSFAMIIDEGGGYSEQYGQIFAVPAVTEKGYIDVRIEVRTPGGISSNPPSHTGIGILSALLVQYEESAPAPRLARGTPVYEMVRCLAEHGPDMSESFRRAIRRSETSDCALREAEAELFRADAWRSLAVTTQAADVVVGGGKANALPELAWALVNHRIATDGSVETVREHATEILADLAHKHNLTYRPFGRDPPASEELSKGDLILSDTWATPPAPVAPTDASAYQLLSGTIRATYLAHREVHGKDPNANQIAVAPGIMSGNTDTRWYWDLSKHIFRYDHHRDDDEGYINIHTVNESILIDSYMEMIRFFTLLILNMDEASL